MKTLLLLICYTFSTFAQDSSKTSKVDLTTKILMDSLSKEEKYVFKNPNSNRYFLSPTAYTLKKGEWAIQNTEILVNSVTYGITDNFSLSAGLSIPVDYEFSYYFLSQKYSFGKRKKMKFSIGNITYSNLRREHYYDDNYPNTTSLYKKKVYLGGVVQANVTWGNAEKNITISIGQPYEFKTGLLNGFFFSVAGMKRVSKHFVLVSEFELLRSRSDWFPWLMVGPKIIGKNASFDIGIGNFWFEYNHSEIAPYLGFQYKFAKKGK